MRLMDYNINIKQIEAGADFKVLGNFKDNKYKLEIYSVLNENTKNKMKNSQMTIGIILKSNEIKILKSTHTDYVLEDKKITITLNNFSLQDKHTIGIMFETLEKLFKLWNCWNVWGVLSCFVVFNVKVFILCVLFCICASGK